MANIPDKQEHRRRFVALDFQDRRAIVRAVNKGRAVEKRKHAPLAVNVARRQLRLWRWGWVPGPLIGLFQLGQGWEVALLNGLIGLVTLGAIARFWYLRAARAEAANLALAEGRRRDAEAISQQRGFASPAPPRRRGRG